MTTQQPVERVTYGNLRAPRRPGVLGMGMAASILVGVAAVIVVIMLMGFGLIAAAITLVASVLVLTPMIAHGPDGHSGYQRLLGRTVFGWSAKAGRTLVVAGAAGQVPDGRTRLPGCSPNPSWWERSTPTATPTGWCTPRGWITTAR